MTLSYLLDYYKLFGDSTFFTNSRFFDLLAGTDQLRKQIIQGYSEQEIKSSWQPALEKYKAIRKKYILYDDFDQ